jgi:hypothetical protein
MEWITKAHKLTLMNAPPRADGRKPEQLAALFRKHLPQRERRFVMYSYHMNFRLSYEYILGYDTHT